MAGSVLVAVAESKSEVIQRLKDDLYTSEGVWDWDKVRCACTLIFRGYIASFPLLNT